MSVHLKQELYLVSQALIGIISALIIVSLLFMISPNYNPFAIICIATGSLILYTLLMKSKKLHPLVATIAGMSIAFSFIF